MLAPPTPTQPSLMLGLCRCLPRLAWSFLRTAEAARH